MIILVFGVTGCGKSTIGAMLAEQLEIPFFDGDHFHPEANVRKMTQGIPLTDEDRWPWLENLAGHIREWDTDKGAVLACSALTEKYRKILQVVPGIQWILLEGSKSLIMERLNARKGHFMDPDLVDSQFKILEIPDYGFRIPIQQSPEDIVSEIRTKLEITQ